jgi:acyl-CoA thioesterase I
MTKAHLAPGKTLKIVVIGGLSTAGTAAGSADKSYPHRLQEILSERHPGSTIIVENKGIAHQTAQQMLDRFERDVIAEQPTLAIWETGITDAVHGVDLEEFAATIQSGLDRLKGSNIETMLIDMQFSRSTASVINFDDYLDALHHAADVNDIYVFRRYQIMRSWSENGVFDFDNWPKAGAPLAAARVYDCLARGLADAIELVAR